MADDQSPVTRDAAWWRRHLRRRSLRVIDKHARAAKAEAPDTWKQTLQEIGDAYYHKLPDGQRAYDLLVALDFTLYFHPKTRLGEEVRREAAALRELEKKAQQALQRFHQELVTGPESRLGLVLAVYRPRPDYELLQTRGRPAEWILDEWAGHLAAILAEARWPNVRGKRPDDDPYRMAFDFGHSLLLEAAGVDVPRKELHQRYWRLKQRGDVPAPPDDNNPLAWFQTLLARLEARGLSRRRFLAPAEELPILEHAVLLTPGSDGPLERFRPRRPLRPAEAERLPEVLPPEDQAIATALQVLMAIAEERGLRQRLMRALAERPGESPPQPQPAPDQRK